jgi:hypothetical protein
MQLHNGQVPDNKVWAVLTHYSSDPSNQFLDWFITADASTMRYKEAVAYLRDQGTGGEASRWLVTLPRQRMESYDVHEFVYHHVITAKSSSNATRLDIFVQPGKGGIT